MANHYVAGTVVTVATYSGSVASPTGGFRDRTGALADPAAVKLSYRKPGDAAATVVTYPTAPIVKDAVGLYRADLDTTAGVGMWEYEWMSPPGDPVQAIARNEFWADGPV